MRDLAGPSLAVHALHVALFAHVQWGIDKRLDEIAGREQLARHLPLLAERRDKADQHDQASIGHQPRDFGHPADVRDPVLVGKAERSAEHTSELKSLMRLPYADFCLKHKKQTHT